MILTDKLTCNRGESRSEFENKVRGIASALHVNPNWLMLMMWNESRLNAQAVNKQKSDTETDSFKRAAFRATGLIQFMPNTAKGLGTSTQALYKMNAIDQLDYVYRYFKPYAGKMKCYTDMYMICFFPVAVGKPDDWVLQTKNLSAGLIAAQNSGLDLNKDGKLTVGEVRRSMLQRIPKQYLEMIQTEEKKSLS